MKKSFILILLALFSWNMQAQPTVGDLPNLDNLSTNGGAAVGALGDFSLASLIDFTLEVTGATADNPVSVANGLITYTPTANGTVRFAYTAGTLFVFENNIYKGIVTLDGTKIVYPDIFGDTDDASSTTGIYDPKNLFLNPGFETKEDGTLATADNYLPQSWTGEGFAISGGSRARYQISDIAATREGNGSMMTHQGRELVQTVSSLLSNTHYKLKIRRWVHNGGGQRGGKWYIGFGTATRQYEIFRGEFSNLDSESNYAKYDHEYTFYSGDLSSYNSIVFSVYPYDNNGSANLPITHYDRMTLVAGTIPAGITGATSAVFLAGTAYAPASVDKSELEALITTATSLKATGTAKGQDYLQAAIEAAQAVVEDDEATLADVTGAIDDLNEAISLYENSLLASLSVDATAIAGFSPNTYTYTYTVAPDATVPTVTATLEAVDAAEINITQATTIPGSATITVTAGDNTTSNYTVSFIVNYMAGWNTYETDNTPQDNDWDVPSETTVTWGHEATINTAFNGFRTNVGPPVDNGANAMLYIVNQDVAFSYPVSIPGNKIYQLSGNVWRRNGSSSTMTSTFDLSDSREGTVVYDDFKVVAEGNNVYVDFSERLFAPTDAATPSYLRLLAHVDGGNWENAGYVNLQLIELGTSINITFNTRGGNAIAAQHILSGETAIEPADPTKENATFLGWYANEALLTEYDFSSSVTSDITLYAKWGTGTSINETLTEEPLQIKPATGGIAVTARTATGLKVYSVIGSLVSQRSLAAGETLVLSLPQGIYIVNGQKIAVRE
jgi:uncharacterized repeat protein (TIGR02543 family)